MADFGFLDHWSRFLPMVPGHIVGVMGSGGKTSLMRELAKWYMSMGIPVVLTTTTRTEPLPDIPDALWPDEGVEPAPDTASGIFLHGGQEDGKWAGLAPEVVDALPEAFPEHMIVVEVDGAAKMPFKLHRSGEPCWPARTSLALVVMGAGSVGAKTKDVLHRHGKVFWPPLAHLADWDIWDWDHCRKLLLGKGGYLDQVPAAVPAALVLTGLDVQEDSIGLFEFAGRAMEDSRLPLVLFCGFPKGGEVRIRTAYRSVDRDADASGVPDGNADPA